MHIHALLLKVVSAAFLASEILIQEELLEFAGIDEMKKINIWTLFMTLFLVINPNQTHPFELNINDSAGKKFVTSAAQQLQDFFSHTESQSAFTCSKLAIKTLRQCVKYVQS